MGEVDDHVERELSGMQRRRLANQGATLDRSSQLSCCLAVISGTRSTSFEALEAAFSLVSLLRFKTNTTPTCEYHEAFLDELQS